MSSLYTLAQSFLSGFKDLSEDQHISLRAPNCTHLFGPASLKSPPLSNTAFASHLTHLKTVMKSFPVTAKEININEEKKQIVIWATGTAHFWDEVKDSNDDEWVYHGEYIFILDVDGDGKIERVVEFLDSLGTMRARGLIERARKKLEENSVRV